MLLVIDEYKNEILSHFVENNSCRIPYEHVICTNVAGAHDYLSNGNFRLAISGSFIKSLNVNPTDIILNNVNYELPQLIKKFKKIDFIITEPFISINGEEPTFKNLKNVIAVYGKPFDETSKNHKYFLKLVHEKLSPATA